MTGKPGSDAARSLGGASLPSRRRAARGLALLAFLPVPAAAQPADAEDGWQRLARGGHVALMRHARAPGTGDPPGFRLEACDTQRNLSETGRAQARAIGAAFTAAGVTVADVRSSRWCRALDTARLAFGRVEPEAALDSFFGEPRAADPRTDALRRLVSSWSGRPGTAVFVTHQVNITALTGVFPAEGEIVVIDPAAPERGLARIRPGG